MNKIMSVLVAVCLFSFNSLVWSQSKQIFCEGEVLTQVVGPVETTKSNKSKFFIVKLDKGRDSVINEKDLFGVCESVDSSLQAECLCLTSSEEIKCEATLRDVSDLGGGTTIMKSYILNRISGIAKSSMVSNTAESITIESGSYTCKLLTQDKPAF